MAEKPIIFSGPMVRAIQAGRKTQTRRLVRGGGPVALADAAKRCPYWADTLWVRETYKQIQMFGCAPEVMYSDDEDYDIVKAAPIGWQTVPSIHMPRWASRIRLLVAEIRCEQLQEISEADAVAEGCSPGIIKVDVGGLPQCAGGGAFSARTAFTRLWDSLNAKRAPWASNPWVWVVTFKPPDTVQRA